MGAQVILDAVTDKNPKNNNGSTPLHYAVLSPGDNCYVLFRTIFDQVKEKNPADNKGKTPLHCAAELGDPLICQLIVSHIEELPIDDKGNSPIDLAKKRERNLGKQAIT